MMEGSIPRTGHLERIVLNENGEEIRRESLLGELRRGSATSARARTA